MNLRTLWIDANGRLRSGWRLVLYLLLSVLLGLVLGLVASGVQTMIGLDPESFTGIAVTYVALCLAVLAPAVVMLRAFDRSSWRVLGIGWHSRAGLEISQGLALGFLLMTVIVLAAWVMGSLERSPASPSDGTASTLVIGVLGAFVALLLAATFEELLFRGYAFQALIQGIGRLGAIGVAAVLFGVAHLSNPNAAMLSTINTALAGVFLAVAYIRTRSLWLPIALHMSWNFTQGVVYGLPVSGIELPARLVSFTATDGGGETGWLTGGAYGPEGGLLLTVAVALATAFVLWSPWIRAAEDVEPIWLAAEEPAGPSQSFFSAHSTKLRTSSSSTSSAVRPDRLRTLKE